MVWKILFCWLGPPWWLHVGGVSSIVGDLVDAIFGAVVVPIFSLSSVSGISGLISIVLAVLHVLRDWASQSTIPAYLSKFLYKLIPLLCQWSRMFVSLLVVIPSESECLCPTIGIFFGRLVVPTPPFSLRLLDCIVSGVLMAVVVGKDDQSSRTFLRVLFNVCHQPLSWWCCQWIYKLMPQWTPQTQRHQWMNSLTTSSP